MAAVAGYSSIGGPGGKADGGIANGPTSTAIAGDVVGGVNVNMGERLSSISRAAGVVAAGAKEAVSTFAAAPMPLVKLYTQPLNPAEELTARARLELVWNSCRSWGDFFDVRSMNLPPASEVKLRMGQNVETFFYNYLCVAMAWLSFQGILHPLRGLQIAAIVTLAVLFYAIHPDPIPITVGPGRTIILADTAKHGSIIAFTAAAFLFGGLASVVFNVIITSAFLVFLHSFLRDHREPEVTNQV